MNSYVKNGPNWNAANCRFDVVQIELVGTVSFTKKEYTIEILIPT
jgi:hypothetical protein